MFFKQSGWNALTCLCAVVVIALSGGTASGQPSNSEIRPYPETQSLLDWQSHSGFHVRRLRMIGRDFIVPVISRMSLSFGTIANPSEQVTDVYIHLLLPNFQPIGKSNAAEDEKPGWPGKLHINFSPRQGRPSLQEQFRLDLDKTPSSHPTELKWTERKYWSEWAYHVGQDGEPTFLAQCYFDKPYNSCTGYAYPYDELFLTYAFSRDEISGWQEIDTKVRALITSFFERRK